MTHDPSHQFVKLSERGPSRNEKTLLPGSTGFNFFSRQLHQWHLSYSPGNPICRSSSKSPFQTARRLWSGEIQQHHIRALLHSFEHNFTAVRRDVEVTNVEVRSKFGQLPLGARLQVDEP